MQEASFYLFKKKTCAPERINAPGALSRLSLQSAKGEHTLSLCRLERKTGFEPATTGLGSQDSTVELLSH